MSQQILNNGEPLYDIRTKINQNFSEIYTQIQMLTAFAASLQMTPTATPGSTAPTSTPAAPTSTPIPPTSTPVPTPAPSLIDYPNYFVSTLTEDDEPVDQSDEDITFASLVSGDTFYYNVTSIAPTESPSMKTMNIIIDSEPRSVVQFDGGRLGTTFGYVTVNYLSADLEFEGYFVNGDVNFQTGTYEPIV